MIAEYIAASVLLLAAMGEWLHARRTRRVAMLAFGPRGQARSWTAGVPACRVICLSLVIWGLINLLMIGPRTTKAREVPEGGYRHLLIVLDVSPSMQLKDAGPTGELTRAKRAGELLLSMLERIALEQVRVSIVAFYTGAKPVVVDTYDLNVVKNIIDDLPLDYAFEIGKTRLFDGLREAAELAKPWKEKSATLFLVSDGDTVPDSGMPVMPASVARVIVVGVGDSRTGKFIDGHQSRQDASTLRQVAARLRGVYHDGNAKHLPSTELAALAKVLPMREETEKGRRELSIAAAVFGSSVLAGISVALALAGSSWRAGRGASTRKLQERSTRNERAQTTAEVLSDNHANARRNA